MIKKKSVTKMSHFLKIIIIEMCNWQNKLCKKRQTEIKRYQSGKTGLYFLYDYSIYACDRKRLS